MSPLMETAAQLGTCHECHSIFSAMWLSCPEVLTCALYLSGDSSAATVSRWEALLQASLSSMCCYQAGAGMPAGVNSSALFQWPCSTSWYLCSWGSCLQASLAAVMFSLIQNGVGGWGRGVWIAAFTERLVQTCVTHLHHAEERHVRTSDLSGLVLTQWLGDVHSPEYGCLHCRWLRTSD